MADDIVKVSKFLSLILRHKPEEIGLALDPNGWADVDELLRLADESGRTLSRDLLDRVVSENDKQRFAFSEDGMQIRASQGHSLDVDLALPPAEPPELLYHGTATRFLDSIRREGLHSRNRQHVHLSLDVTQRGSRKQIAHGGGINGFSTFILRVPEEKLCVVVLSNVLPSQPGRMANDLASIVLGETYTTPQTRRVVQVDPKTYDTYVGRYQIVPQFVITITREGDKLIGQATNQGKIEFAPESETKFFSKLVNAEGSLLAD